MWLRGWDEEYGGILYYRDVMGLPVTEYWQDMKFWWPHNEAIIATLMAYQMTGDEKYASWHRMVHDWAYAHFPDPEYGEWFGYLHRDGRISTRLKGNLWKGPFHLPGCSSSAGRCLNRSRPRGKGEPGGWQTGRTQALVRGDLSIMLRDLVLENRSRRRFDQEAAVKVETLRELVDLARLSASGGNLQPLKYALSCDPAMNARVFETLAWAGYLKDWPGPEEGERPAAYIIVLGDKTITQSFGCDHGIAAQSILLGATEMGLGGCMIGSIRRPALSQAMAIPAEYEILLVIALGRPKERVVLEAVEPGGNIKYWRDEQAIHHVPKRSLEEIIVG